MQNARGCLTYHLLPFTKLFFESNKLHFNFARIFCFSVYELGGRCYFRLQLGERGELQRHIQLLRQNVPVQEHARNPSHPRWDTRYFSDFATSILLFCPFPPKNSRNSMEIPSFLFAFTTLSNKIITPQTIVSYVGSHILINHNYFAIKPMFFHHMH